MPTPREIRDAIDTRLAALWPTLKARQDAYCASHGRYFQGLRTHSAMPDEGNNRAADRINSRPTDQAETWSDFGIGSFTESFAVEIDVYDGPRGKGWIARCYVTAAGRTFTRAKGEGPEDHEQPWHEVPASPF